MWAHSLALGPDYVSRWPLCLCRVGVVAVSHSVCLASDFELLLCRGELLLLLLLLFGRENVVSGVTLEAGGFTNLLLLLLAERHGGEHGRGSERERGRNFGTNCFVEPTN